MDELRRRQAIRSLRETGMAEMAPTGRYRLTRAGERFLDRLEVMHDLDDRPAPAPEEQQAGRSTPEAGTRAGDDVRPARRARGKRTRP